MEEFTQWLGFHIYVAVLVAERNLVILFKSQKRWLSAEDILLLSWGWQSNDFSHVLNCVGLKFRQCNMVALRYQTEISLWPKVIDWSRPAFTARLASKH